MTLSFDDDFPVMNAYINSDCLNEFYDKVISLHDDYKIFSAGEFLTRSYVFSGKYFTFAGALMFSNIIRVRADLVYYGGRVAIEAQNIWEAYCDLLPRLTSKLSLRCRRIYHKAFLNALLFSDYSIDNKININITSKPPQAIIDNPGIINGTFRNHRLKKILRLAGILEEEKNHDSNLKINLEQDNLNFRVKARINLEGASELPKPIIL